VSKAGDTLYHGDFPRGCSLPAGTTTARVLGGDKRSYGDIAAVAQDGVEFLELLKKHHTRDFILQHDRILSYAAKYYAEPPVPYVPQFEQDQELVPQELKDWVALNLV